MKLAILGRGNVTKALLPLLADDERFQVAAIHSRSQPAAANFSEFLDSARAHVLVELTTLNPLTGEPAISHCREAFRRKMNVVTANKGPVAHAFHQLAQEAAANGVEFRFESSVMDGTPIFSQFRNNLPGVQVLGFAGVLNSTTNLVIEALERGQSFETGLAHAREIGIAEADACYDVEGWDSAAKAAALANVLMNAQVSPQNVSRHGIAGLTPERMRALNQDGKTIRLVSRAVRVSGEVKLHARAETISRTDILAGVGGTSNIILFQTDRMGTLGTISLAPGVEQTAYGVYCDLVGLLGGC